MIKGRTGSIKSKLSQMVTERNLGVGTYTLNITSVTDSEGREYTITDNVILEMVEPQAGSIDPQSKESNIIEDQFNPNITMNDTDNISE